MDRRAFIGTAAVGVLVLSSRASAQRAEKVPRVAVVFRDFQRTDIAGTDPVNRLARAFVHRMRELGFVEGRNIVIDRRSAEGRFELMPAIMRELVISGVDVIVTTDPEEADARPRRFQSWRYSPTRCRSV